MIRTKRIAGGGWRTVESFGYGGDRFGFDLQTQTLDGFDLKKLEVGLLALGYACR